MENSAPSQFMAWTKHRDMATARRWPMTASPFDQRALNLDGTEAGLLVDQGRDFVNIGACCHLFYQARLVTSLERPVKADARDRLAVGGKAEEEEGHTVAVLEIAPSQGLFEPVVPVDALGPVQVHLPEVRSLEGMMALEANA